MFKKNQSNNYLIKIIYINIILFIIVSIANVLSFLFQENINIVSFLGVSSNLQELILHPWTIITYMFIHEDFYHIIINLFWLYFSGNIFITYLTQKKFLSTYIMGGIFGALIYVISFNIFPAFNLIKSQSIAIGASASVFAILIAAASQVPNYPINLIFINKLKLKHIAIIAIIIDLLSIPKGNAGGHIAHLGGAIYGYIYIYFLKKNININSIIEDTLSLFIEKNKIIKKRAENDYEYNTRKIYNQKKIDQILDKISRSGYDSLSNYEKEELFKNKDL